MQLDRASRPGSNRMSVADLGPSRTELLACRTVLALHQSRVGERVLHSRKAVGVLDLVEDRVMRVLDVSKEVGSAADQVEPSSQQIPCRPHLGWIDVGLRQVPTPSVSESFFSPRISKRRSFCCQQVGPRKSMDRSSVHW